MMKLFKKWFRSENETSGTAPGREPGGDSDYADPDPPADDSAEDASYDSRSMDLSSSSIFDSPDTHRVRILKSAPRRPANDDNNPGYDPYDTGRFSADKKS
jgi:hypothetical protein